MKYFFYLLLSAIIFGLAFININIVYVLVGFCIINLPLEYDYSRSVNDWETFWKNYKNYK